MNRRGFFRGLFGAIAAAAVAPLLPKTAAKTIQPITHRIGGSSMKPITTTDGTYNVDEYWVRWTYCGNGHTEHVRYAVNDITQPGPSPRFMTPSQLAREHCPYPPEPGYDQ